MLVLRRYLADTRLLFLLFIAFLVSGSIELKAQAPVLLLDTVRPISHSTCLGDLVIWYAGSDGPIFGNNAFGDLEKAQQLSLPAGEGAFLVGAIFWWGKKKIGSNGMLRAKAYTVDPTDNSPLDLISTSADVEVNDVDTSIHHNLFLFPDAPLLYDQFFISLDLSSLTSGDSVVILATEDGCGSGCAVWEKWSGGGWHNVCGTYSFTDIDLIAEAVVEWEFVGTTGINEFVTAGNISIYPASPNPAKQQIHLPFSLEHASEVHLSIYGLDGKRYRDIDLGLRNSGQHSYELDLSAFPAGSWIYRLSSENGAISSRFQTH